MKEIIFNLTHATVKDFSLKAHLLSTVLDLSFFSSLFIAIL